MSAPSSWPGSCRPPQGRAGSRSTSGSRCARSWPRHLPSRSATEYMATEYMATEYMVRTCKQSTQMNEALLRSLTPSVLGILVRRGASFAAAEDAVQDALVEAVRGWPADPPTDPKGWLVTVAWRRFLDATRSDAARRRREDLAVVQDVAEPAPGSVPGSGPAVDDTLWLYFLCAHPS